MAESCPYWSIPELSSLPPLPPSPCSVASSIVPTELYPPPLFSGFSHDIERQHARYVAGRSGGIFEQNPESSIPFDYRYVRRAQPSEYSASVYSQLGLSDFASVQSSHQDINERTVGLKPEVLEAIVEDSPEGPRNASGNSKKTGTTDHSFYSAQSTRAQLDPTGDTPRQRRKHRPFPATLSRVASSLCEKLRLSKRRKPVCDPYSSPANRSEEIAYCSRVVSQIRTRAEAARLAGRPSLLQTSQWKSSHPPMEFTLPPEDFSVSPIKLTPTKSTQPYSYSTPDLRCIDMGIPHPTRSAPKTPSPAKTTATATTATSNVTSIRSVPTQHTPSTASRAEEFDVDRANVAFFEVPRQEEERRVRREERNKEKQDAKMTGGKGKGMDISGGARRDSW